MARPVGSLNKPKHALIALLQAKYPGYNPVLELAAIANNDVECAICEGNGKVFDGVEILDDITVDKMAVCEECHGTGKQPISMDMKFNANKEVAQYVTPKLKAVEITGDVDNPLLMDMVVEFVNAPEG